MWVRISFSQGEYFSQQFSHKAPIQRDEQKRDDMKPEVYE